MVDGHGKDEVKSMSKEDNTSKGERGATDGREDEMQMKKYLLAVAMTMWEMASRHDRNEVKPMASGGGSIVAHMKVQSSKSV
ncbi:uncharacterized protein N7511_002221 [Penicillium nucicola]|uniref:uncharacterized protein n=1 Tax=Penicillium nucicola TaxID=1850975 RepID=UPI00254590AF|nr:uncharacterized protein N7511_002221 [Penicillium nucicola]KAJ5770170.1 hypothetical protein N7511_002221 [Penicillium nucicola]